MGITSRIVRNEALTTPTARPESSNRSSSKAFGSSLRFLALISATHSINNFDSSKCPESAAKCKAVASINAPY